MKIKVGILVNKKKVIFKKVDRNFVIKDREVLLRIKSVGICGSDVGFIKHEFNPQIFKKDVILGHEFTAEIVKIGKDVKNVKVGDLVVGDAGVSCGKCEYCLLGRGNLCENIKFYGFPPFDGAFQELMVFPAKFIFCLPKEINKIQGTLVEPLAVCLNALSLSGFTTGDRVVVVGCGPIGLILVKLLKSMKAEKIVAIDPLGFRRKAARKSGADVVLSSKVLDREIDNIIGKKKMDIIFDAASNNTGTKSVIKFIKGSGIVVMIGIPGIDDFINISHIEARKKGLTIKMVRRFENKTLEKAIDLLRSGFNLDELITHQYRIEEIEKAFDTSLFHQNKSLKVVVNF